MKGFKVFNVDWTCRGFQYEVGKTYELPAGSELKICECGFHFCENLMDVFGYYPYYLDTKIAEVEALGEIQKQGTKFCTNKIRIIREVPRDELILQSSLNIGVFNTGDYNIGNFNSGDYNVGNYNSGNYNIGDCNSGVDNVGSSNTGNSNTGNCNTEDYNTGDFNTGNRNTGDCNTGDFNTGNRNSGYYNTGDFNTGDYNSGYYNTGDFNTGDFNTGCFNTGDYNKADFCPGIFNTVEPKMWAFNRQCNVTYTEFLKGLNYDYNYLLSAISRKKIDDDDIKHIKKLPNFDPEIFKEITGIDLT